MSADVSSGERSGLVARARDILIRPQSEWRRIAGEQPSPLMGPYIVPLAILGAVAGFGARLLYDGVTLNAALAWRGASAALYVLFAVLGVIAVAMIIRFFAKRFGAETEPGRAQQLAAYSATPILIAAVGALAGPAAPIFTAAGVAYALILLSIGVGQVLALPDAENNVPRFTLAVLVTSAVGAALATMLIGPLVNSGREALTGAVEAGAPPPAAPEIAERSPAELAIERLTQGYGARVLTDPARLGEQYPDTLPGGLARQSVATAARGGVSRADAVYAREGASMRLSIIQLGATLDPVAGAALFDVAPDGAREGGYTRSQSIDGRFYVEAVEGEHVRYVVIGRGVAMIAEGDVTVDQARAAIETIDLARLEAAFGR